MFKANINNSSQQELLSCWFCDHVSSNVNKLWLLLCYLLVPFHLASPPDFTLAHIPKGNLVNTFIHVFIWPFGIFFCTGRGSFLVLSGPWHTGSLPESHTQDWAQAEVRGTCSGGSKWHVHSGRRSEHVEPSRPPANPRTVQVKIMSHDWCDIWDLECHQRRQTLLTWDGNVFPRHQHARHSTTFNTLREMYMTSEGYYRSLLTHMTTRWLGRFTCDPQRCEYTIIKQINSH